MATQNSMAEKVCLVTGASDGIGKVAAGALARMGATVVLVGRNQAKTSAVVDEIKKQTGNQRVEYLLADLSDQAQVRRLAESFQQHHDQLDVLINNAGAIFLSRQVSADDYEMTFALNHLAYFLLTNLLLDLIKASAPARIVNTSSAAHHGARLDFDNLQNERGYSGFSVYGQTKLANLYFTYELARRLEGSQVTANALHPGFVATSFGKNNGSVPGFFFSMSHIAAISPEEGAETIVYLATSPEVEGVSGKYFYKKKVEHSSQISYDQDIARRLWQVSLNLTGLAETVSA
jgi:retinol dehydrogenase-12